MSTVLTTRLWFPDPRSARKGGEFDGLVAMGGDLSAPRLLLGYRNGIFPWTDNPITWWSPDPRASNGSKVALCFLTRHLRERGFALFDIQSATPITRQLGAIDIPREEYLGRLRQAVEMDCTFFPQPVPAAPANSLKG